ncbi:hypothetical protein CsSME_00019077 [Camellia sinensis var. sinensis]
MGSSLHLSLFMHLLFLSLSCFHLVIIMANSLSAEQPISHADENSTLLQFKQSFSIDKSTSSDPLHHGSSKEIVVIAAHGMASNAIRRRVM